jgi:hypothetical protein
MSFRDERLVLAIKQDIARARNLQREAQMWERVGRPWLAVGARAGRDDALKFARALRLSIVRGHRREVLVRLPGQPDRIVTLLPGTVSLIVPIPLDPTWCSDDEFIGRGFGQITVTATGKRTPGRCEIWAPAHQAAPQGDKRGKVAPAHQEPACAACTRVDNFDRCSHVECPKRRPTVHTPHTSGTTPPRWQSE